MAYIEITTVPIPEISEETVSVLAPAAAVAARISGEKEEVELRIQKKDGLLHAYVGISSVIRAKQLQNELERLRCGYRLAKTAELSILSADRILLRQVSPKYYAIPEKNRGILLSIAEISSDAARRNSLYYTLARLSDGAGYAVWIKKAPAFDLQTAAVIKTMAEQSTKGDGNDALWQKLLHAREGYSCMILPFGQPGDVEILEEELLYAFPGLASCQMARTDLVPEKIWKAAEDAAYKRMPKGGAILSSFLYPEVETLANLDGIAKEGHGPRLNHDTLFPLQEIRERKESGPFLLLGTNEAEEKQLLPLNELKKHMFIGGAPGSGKGNLIFSIANQLHRQNIPMLLIESAKEEQHYLAKTMQLRTWRPKGGQFVWNPFALPPKVTLEDYRASMKAILRTCFRGDGPLEELYDTTLSRCLSRYGYTESSTADSGEVSPFGLQEFMEEFQLQLCGNGYSAKTLADIKSAGTTRLRTLFDQNADVFDSVVSVPVTELLQGENLIQLNCLTTLEAKQMFASMLLITLGAYLKLNGQYSQDLQLVIVLDEAHNLLKGVEKSQEGAEKYSFAEDFLNLLLEFRSIGVGVIVADQSADNLPEMISRMCATKIFLGPSRYSGIETYADLFQAKKAALDHLYMLEPGEGIWNTYGMAGGAVFQMPNIIDRYHLEQPYPVSNSFMEQNKRMFTQSFLECRTCALRGDRTACTLQHKQEARRTADRVYAQYLGAFRSALQETEQAERAAGEEETNAEHSRMAAKKAMQRMQKVLLAMADGIAEAENAECCIIQLFRHIRRENVQPVRNVYIEALKKMVESKKKEGSGHV